MGPPIKLSSPATREFWEIPVLFEDECLLAVDKPAGLLTSPDPRQTERVNLLDLLHAGIATGKPWAATRKLTYLVNAQRMDEPASGVLLFARNKATLVSLLNTFNSESFMREYVVLVHGHPAQEKGEVETKLAPDRSRPGYVRVDHQRGKRSRTRFEVRERFQKFSLLHCAPYPDRAHQLRVHLRHVGFPVVGDGAYRGQPLLLSKLKPAYYLKPGRQEQPLIARAALHCERLVFPHPVSGEEIVITAPLPKDLSVGLKYLRRYGVGGSGEGPEPDVTQ